MLLHAVRLMAFQLLINTECMVNLYYIAQKHNNCQHIFTYLVNNYHHVNYYAVYKNIDKSIVTVINIDRANSTLVSHNYVVMQFSHNLFNTYNELCRIMV